MTNETKILLTSDETSSYIKKVYYENNIAEAARILDMSITTLMNRIKEHKIPLKGYSGNGRKKKQIFINQQLGD